MKKYLMVLCLIIFSLSAFGQYSAVTGTITDAGGNLATSGTVVFRLSGSSGVQYYFSGTSVVTPTTTTCTISGVGTVSCNVGRNDLLSPGGTTYCADYYPNGVKTNTVCKLYIATASYNLNSPVFLTTQPSPQFSATQYYPITGSIIPNGNNIFNLGDPNHYYANGYIYNLFLTNLANIVIATGNTDTGIQNAINAAPSGGTVFIPAGTWNLCNALPITTTKSVNITGAGWATVLSVCSTASATTDIFLVQPPLNTVLYGGSFRNFYISPATIGIARHGFYLDGTNGTMQNWVFDNIRVEQLGGNSVFATGPGYNEAHNPQGIPVLTTFSNGLWRGGFQFNNSGDTNRIINSQITGNGKAVEASFQSGATGFQLLGNNITSNGGLHFGTNVYQPQITGNEFETFATFTGSNGAFIDFDGIVGTPIQEGIIRDNTISIVNSVVADAVRLNYAVGVKVTGNRFAPVTAGVHCITATANSSVNTAYFNDYGTFVYTTMFNDSGTGNLFLNTNGTSGSALVLGNNRAIQAFDAAGNIYNMITYQPGAGATTLYGYQSRKAVEGGGGVTYMFEGDAGNTIGLAVSNANSSVPAAGSVASSDKFFAKSGLQINTSGTTISDTRELVQSAHSCGTTTTCSNTTNGSNRMIFGTVTLAAGTATITGISPAFTSTSSFVCSGTDQTSAAAVKIANASTSSITVTGTGTDVISYQCIGN